MSAGLLEWLVIGGGVHGTYLSYVLVTGRGESAERVRVLDREAAPLSVFWRCAGSTAAIIGGGISAVHQFDSDPGWLGLKHMSAFRALPDGSRRPELDRARYRGSVPPELGRALRRAIHRGSIRWVEVEVQDLVESAGPGIMLALDRSPHRLAVDHLIFATGFARTRPGGRLIDSAITSIVLPCASCGFPLTRETLEWTPGLFITGALAELQLGPTARNIAGARAAGERLARTDR